MVEGFDELSRTLAHPTSRRQVLKALGATVGAGVMSLLHPRRASALGRPPEHCGTVGIGCHQDSDCCGGEYCPDTHRCACSPGYSLCEATGFCVACGHGRVLNQTSCTCECDVANGYTLACGATSCCAPANECCDTSYGGHQCLSVSPDYPAYRYSCPATQTCVRCNPRQTFDASTCTCQCPTETTQCYTFYGDSVCCGCSPGETVCVTGRYLTCSATNAYCSCATTTEGTTTCVNLAATSCFDNPLPCTSSAECAAMHPSTPICMRVNQENTQCCVGMGFVGLCVPPCV